MKQNYPNPFREETVFPIILDEKSTVSIDLFDASGRKVFGVIDHQNLTAGKQEIKMSRNQLKSGMYVAKITIDNSKGTFIENLKVLVH